MYFLLQIHFWCLPVWWYDEFVSGQSQWCRTRQIHCCQGNIFTCMSLCIAGKTFFVLKKKTLSKENWYKKH